MYTNRNTANGKSIQIFFFGGEKFILSKQRLEQYI